MDNVLFKKNIAKTIAVKGTKLGMRSASKNSARTNMAHAIVELKRDLGFLFQSLSPYILGFQMNQEMKEAAASHLGDIGADLISLCRVVKVKIPSATKKSKLTCTRTAALLQLDGLTTDMLSLVEAGVFTSPKMVKVKKMVNIPTKGIQEEREVDTVDTEAEDAAAEGRVEVLESLLATSLDLYWKLCYEILGKTPSEVFDSKVQRMQKLYPDVEFEMVKVKKPEQVSAA